MLRDYPGVELDGLVELRDRNVLVWRVNVTGGTAGAEHDRGDAGRSVDSGLGAACLGAEIERMTQSGERRQAGADHRGVRGSVERRVVALDLDPHVEWASSSLLFGEALEGLDD